LDYAARDHGDAQLRKRSRMKPHHVNNNKHDAQDDIQNASALAAKHDWGDTDVVRAYWMLQFIVREVFLTSEHRKADAAILGLHQVSAKSRNLRAKRLHGLGDAIRIQRQAMDAAKAATGLAIQANRA